DGDSIDREPAHGGDGATDGDPDGRPRKSVERTRRHLVEQRPGGGRGERHRVGDGAWDRGGNDHGDERGTERERGRDGDARERFDAALHTWLWHQLVRRSDPLLRNI